MLIRTWSLWQPHASLIRPEPGMKRVETRPKPVSYRGPVAIHAAKKWDAALRPALEIPAIYHALTRAGFPYAQPLRKHISQIDQTSRTVACWHGFEPKLPLGAVVAVAWIAACIPTDFLKIWATRNDTEEYKYGWLRYQDGEYVVHASQRPLGNFLPGRFAIFFSEVIVLPEPIPLRGQQGMWTAALSIPSDIERRILAAGATGRSG